MFSESPALRTRNSNLFTWPLSSSTCTLDSAQLPHTAAALIPSHSGCSLCAWTLHACCSFDLPTQPCSLCWPLCVLCITRPLTPVYSHCQSMPRPTTDSTPITGLLCKLLLIFLSFTSFIKITKTKFSLLCLLLSPSSLPYTDIL